MIGKLGRKKWGGNKRLWNQRVGAEQAEAFEWGRA
jgi:hypothetical protein